MTRPVGEALGGRVIAVLGAESTGKTTLVHALAGHLRSQGRDAVAVPEVLREFCEQQGRTPVREEQAGIAAAQSARIWQAVEAHDWVVADTTALTIAVYSELIFDDRSLYPQALADHRAQIGLTLLTSLDLPWVEDGFVRDGPHMRVPVDHALRQVLADAGVGYAVVAGQGEARTAHAACVVDHWAAALQRGGPARRSWRWFCDHCGDGDCERHSLLPRAGGQG